MAEPGTMSAEAPEANGVLNGNLDDEDKASYRPPDIDADVKEMERRKRVDHIMSSKIFKEELEKIIEQQIMEGGAGSGSILEQISNVMGASKSWKGSMLFRGGSCMIPINDIRGVDNIGYAKGEKMMRCKLAALYRIIDLHGWSEIIYNHITLRVHAEEDQFLINPFGMLYNEITASSLVKVDIKGNIIEPGTTNLGVNVAGFTLHSAIHASRPDLKCIVHHHHPAAVAISSLKCGFLPLSQEAAIVGDVSYHDYQGIVIDPAEKDLIIRNLGPFNKILFLRNHGVVCCGESVEEAFLNTFLTVKACEIQMSIMPLGLDNVIIMSEESRKKAYDTARTGGGINSKEIGVVVDPNAKPSESKREKKWKFGEQEFEALMRCLDNAGYRTGHMYKQPLIKSDLPRPKYDVELPPAVSSMGYLLEEEEMYRNHPNLKKLLEGKRGAEKTRWLNSPNVYQKVEVLETGTQDPKKITKWVAEGSPTHSTPVKIDGTLQFVPKNTNPKEFKKLQQQIKENRRAGDISAGPQSQILEGVTWDEARQVQDANMSGTGEQIILVGAASKGIIQRDFQHNATVYKQPFAKNPFDSVTNEELEAYKQSIENKNRVGSPVAGGGGDTDEDSRDGGPRPQVLEIETKQVPVASNPEVIRSEANDFPEPYVSRSKSARFPRQQEAKPERQRRWSDSEKNPGTGAQSEGVNGEEVEALQHQSTFSHSSKEGSPTKDISTEDSSSKAEKKKKKKGLKTPSFLKKKKEKKKGEA